MILLCIVNVSNKFFESKPSKMVKKIKNSKTWAFVAAATADVPPHAERQTCRAKRRPNMAASSSATCNPAL